MLVSGPYKQIKKTPRYLKQRNRFSCGVIALLNVLKWAGYNITYKRDFKRAYNSCKCSRDGVYPNYFDIAIRRYKNLVVMPEDGPFNAPPISLVDECLDNYGSVVFAYIYKYKGKIEVSHLTLCIGKVGKQYLFVNNSTGAKKVLILQRRSTVVKMLRFSDPDFGGCECWFLTRLGNKTIKR